MTTNNSKNRKDLPQKKHKKGQVIIVSNNTNNAEETYKSTCSLIIPTNRSCYKVDGINGTFYNIIIGPNTILKDGKNVSGWNFQVNGDKLLDINVNEKTPEYMKKERFLNNNKKIIWNEDTNITIKSPYNKEQPSAQEKISISAKEFVHAINQGYKATRQQYHAKAYERVKLKDISVVQKTDLKTDLKSLTMTIPKSLIDRPVSKDKNGQVIINLATKKDGSPALDKYGKQKTYTERLNFIHMPKGFKMPDAEQNMVDVSNWTFTPSNRFVSQDINDSSQMKVFIPLQEITNKGDSAYIKFVSPDKKESIKCSPSEFAAQLEAQGASFEHTTQKPPKPVRAQVTGKNRVENKTKTTTTPTQPTKQKIQTI